MNRNELPDDLKLSEEQVRAIVERAAREPAASSLITLAQLREIATELDIDPAALDTATREVLRGAAPPDQVEIGAAESILRKASRANLGRAALLATFTIALGVFTTYVEAGGLDAVLNRTTMPGSGSFIDVPVAAFLIALSLANAYSRLRVGKRLHFLLESAATWMGFAAGWTLGHGGVTADLATFVAVVLTGSLLLTWKRTNSAIKRIRGALAALAAKIVEERARSGEQSGGDRVEAVVAALRAFGATTGSVSLPDPR
jgi:hypothetical protein